MAPQTHQMASSALAGRIQGFGNVDPPPVDEGAKSVAKRAVGNLGSMIGEEVLLTVKDFREKGAIGAVKDTVADAGDILIDGVTGIFGWIRGKPPAADEEENGNSEKAAQVLAQGPSNAAYGVTHASPTGGINAVWVMPDEADPATLAQLAHQPRGPGFQPNHMPGMPMQIPGGPTIQPYQPSMQVPGGPVIQPYQPHMQVPGGPAIQPYAPTPKGQKPSPAMQGCLAFRPTAPGMPPVAAPGAPAQGIVVLLEQVAKGELIVGPETLRRLLRQCDARLSGQQLGDAICERVRRLYLGLEGCTDADARLLRFLSLADALGQQEDSTAKAAAAAVAKGVSEELLSLQCSARHKEAALPMLQRLGLAAKKMPEVVDLLGEDPADAAGGCDLLGGFAPAGPAQAVDLLGL